LLRVLKHLLVGGLVTGLSGCAWLASLKIGAPVGAPRPESTELVRRILERNERFRSLRTLASVDYAGPDGKIGFKEIVLIERPERLRLETLSPMGVLMIVTADANEIAGFETRERLFYRGKSSLENLYRFTRLPMELGELTALLMGQPPAAPGLWQADGDRMARDLGEGWKEAIGFDRTQWIPTSWQRADPQGNVQLAVQWSEFFSTAAGPFPLKIVFEEPARQRRLQLRYEEPEINLGFEPARFVQPKPDGAREVPLESLGG